MFRSLSAVRWSCLLLTLVAGCSPKPAPPAPAAAVAAAATNLQAELDAVLDYTLRQRRLNTVDQGAWQIMHGVLAFQHAFPVQIGRDGPTQSAVEYALAGGAMDGWIFEPGDVLDPATGRRGLRAILQAGTKRGQGHAEQWLAYLANCGLTLDQPLVVNGQQHRLRDLVQQVQLDIPRNVEQEWSWTLIGLTKYLPTTAQWTARDQQTWSIERLLRAELDQDIDRSACGGTHRMMAIAIALRRHREAGGAITGVWQEAEQRVQQALDVTRQMQNPDGSFSVNYFERPGQSADLAIGLGATGHILEFATIALPPQRLKEPWVARAAGYLCELLRQTEGIALECGALYHAAHGLVLYREHVFSPRTYDLAPPTTTSSRANPVRRSAATAAAPIEQRKPSQRMSRSDGRPQQEATDPLTQTRPISNAEPPYSVQLGTPALTTGIPGSGPLTLQQIQDWLSHPQHHRMIEPLLPPGLSAAQAHVQQPDRSPTNSLTRAKIELGRQLFFEPRLSADGTVSCASCHDPDQGYTTHTQFSSGIHGQTGTRNAPVSYNRILSEAQFWDGRAASLEAQAAGPIANPVEMGNTLDQAVATIRQIAGYQLQFDKIFPGQGVNIETITQAIAAFERAIVTDTAPYDHLEFVRSLEKQLGDELDQLPTDDPLLYARYLAALEGSRRLSGSARRGRDLFFAEHVGCTTCHAGANFTDEKYYNLGVGMETPHGDPGRYEVTRTETDRGAFKTPTLRNVALSAPYMHDGSQATLGQVVQWYHQGGHANPFLSDKIKKLDLSPQQQQDLVAFMSEALTSPLPSVRRDRLPQ